MRRIVPVLLLLLLLVPSCEKSKDKAKHNADKPSAARATVPAQRGEVLATLQLPAGDSLGELAPIVDKFQPGAAAQAAPQIAMLLGQVTGMDLSAVDLSKPVSLVLVNPKKHKQPVALLVTAKDAKQLESSAKGSGLAVTTRGGLSLVGSPEVVASVRDFTFAALATPSKRIEAVAYPAALYKVFQADYDQRIDAATKAMGGAAGQGFTAVFTSYKEMLAAVATQGDRMVLRFDTSHDSPGLVITLHPVQGSTMAAFAAAQIPSTHALLARLPGDTAGAMVYSGDMRAGAARKPLVDFFVRMTGAMYDKRTGDELAKVIGPAIDAFDGRVAMTMSMNIFPGQSGSPGMSMRYLAGTSDASAMRAAMRRMFQTMAGATKNTTMMGMNLKVAFKQNALQVDGNEVDHYRTEFDLAQMPEEQRAAMVAAGTADQDMYFTATKDVAIMATTKDGAGTVKTMLDAAGRGSGGFTPTGPVAKAIAESKKRKESALMYMDLNAMTPPGAPTSMPFRAIVMGMGSDKGALVVRVSLGL